MASMKHQVIDNIPDLVSSLGGPVKVGKALRITQGAVSLWSIRDHIPAGWHLRLYLECRNRGLEVAPEVFGLKSFDDISPAAAAE